MKKFTKVLLALLLALTMAFVFSACGDDSSDDDGDGDGDGGTPGGSTTWDLAALKALSGGIKLYVGGNNPPEIVDGTSDKVVKVTYVDSSMFYVDFADIPSLTGANEVGAGDKLKVTYACFVEAGVPAVSIKDGADSWTDATVDGDAGPYPVLQNGKSKTLPTITATAATDGVTFQFNTYYAIDEAGTKPEGFEDTVFYVKILKVEVTN